jgi:hypothetical protein
VAFLRTLPATKDRPPAARSLAGEPLVLTAGRLLAAVPEGGRVIITTGSVSRTWVSPAIGENDGPLGSAALARALAVGRQATSYVVTEESLSAGTAAPLVRAGLSLVTAEQAARYEPVHGRLAMAVMCSLAVEDEPARIQSEELLDSIRPDLVIAVERAGRSATGIYHNARGMDYGEGRARADLLVTAAQERSIPVVAVGDGGNEIGMGLVAEAVRENVPYGRECVCGCGGGIGAAQGADALVVAGCSNWGCYGIAGALAVLLRRDDLVHTAAMEAALLDTAASAGLIDSSDGLSSDAVDGFPRSTHEAMAALIQDIAVRAVGSA